MFRFEVRDKQVYDSLAVDFRILCIIESEQLKFTRTVNEQE